MRFLGKINHALRGSTAVYRCDACKDILSTPYRGTPDPDDDRVR
jgi:hypothetical protein